MRKLGGEILLYIGLGCLSFLLLFLFDLNKIKNYHSFFNILFLFAAGTIAFATAMIALTGQPAFVFALPLRIVFFVLSGICALLMIYSLFFALPFSKTYLSSNKGERVVNTGMYALCRHPGVIWFFLLYLFLWLSTGVVTMLVACFMWTAADVIHVLIQDIWFFPKTLAGYEDYKKEAPFLIPSFASIKRFFTALHQMGVGDDL